MLKSIQQVATEELRSLVEFSKGIIVKESEIADAAEVEAITRSGAGYKAVERASRDWRQVIAFTTPGSSIIESRQSASWVLRAVGRPAARLGIDTSGGIWEFFEIGGWLNEASGVARVNPDASWRMLDVPPGEVYVDPLNIRYYIPIMIWYDNSTGEYSTLGPSGNEFVENTGGDTYVYPDGLSELISTSQEYVTAKINLASGIGTPEERARLEAAIISFEKPGLWEDVRQPLYATDVNGNVILDDRGIPQINPLRVVEVVYRGELNDYYRRLVRDHNLSPFIARTAEQFEIMTWSATTSALSANEQRRYVSIHSECVRVFKTAFYNEAYEGDPLYFAYCRMFIAWMAVMRMVNDKMAGVHDVDRMDSYDLTNMLYSFGIYSFDDIPLVYKRRFAKALHRMLGNKGTTNVFKDILGIFGLDRDIRIWKHYLVKYFPFTEHFITISRDVYEDEEELVAYLDNGEYLKAPSLTALADRLLETGAYRNVVVKERKIALRRQRDVEEISVSSIAIIRKADGAIIEYGISEFGGTDFGAPEVGFHKVDIDDQNAESTVGLLETADIADYTEFVSKDPTWETSREDARQMAFSTLQTKYFSISSAIDTVYNGMSMGMIWSMLKDAEIRGRSGKLNVVGSASIPGVTGMTIFEALVGALILTLWRLDVEDIIPHGESGVSTIIAARNDGVPFPNEGTLLPFSVVLERVADKPDPLTAQNIASMNDTNIDIAQRIDMAGNDNARYGTQDYHSLYGGEETRSYNIDVQLRKIWDHKFISKYQTAAFGASKTYSEWLYVKNPELMDWIKRADDSDDYTEALLTLTSLIGDTIESRTLNLPAILGVDDILLHYIERMIRFFKAYTTDLRQISTFLLIDRPATESVRLINLLAGLIAKLDFSNRLVDLKDLARAISRFSHDEVKQSGMFTELFEAINKLKEHEIVIIQDHMPVWALQYIRTNPAAVMQDSFNIRGINGLGDHLTMATRFQRNGDIATTSDVDQKVTMSEYDALRKWRSNPRHGLADGAVVFSSDNS